MRPSQAKASFFTYKTPMGAITIGASDKGIANVTFGEAQLEGTFGPTDVTNECATQLLEYLAGKRYVINVPDSPSGTDFQLKVWEAVRSVPYGQTRTFAEIAELMDEPTSYRLVGAALRENPLEILTPAHRVVSSNGRSYPGDLRSKMHGLLREIERKHS